MKPRENPTRAGSPATVGSDVLTAATQAPGDFPESATLPDTSPTSAEAFRARVLRALDRARPLDPIVHEDISDRQSDRSLKQRYANWFIWILIGQLVVMSLVVLGTGLRWLAFDEWILQLYMTGTMLEVFGVALVITNHLFPKREE